MFNFKVQGRQFQSQEQMVTGEEILEIAGLTPPDDYELYIKTNNREFEPIQLQEQVDLSQPGLEKFKIRRRIEIPYLIDDEYFSSYECFITPRQILQENGYSPDKFYLKEIIGHSEVSFKNDVDHFISLRPNTKFITCKKSPTPVS